MKIKPPAIPAPVSQRKPPPVLSAGCSVLLCRDQVAAALAISTRTLSAMISAGEFPSHDCRVSKSPRWHVDTLNEWIRAKCGKE